MYMQPNSHYLAESERLFRDDGELRLYAIAAPRLWTPFCERSSVTKVAQSA
jgi:hypothetical protein